MASETNYSNKSTESMQFSPTYDKQFQANILPQKKISGFRKEFIHFLIQIYALGILSKHFKSPTKWVKIIKKINENQKKFQGEHRIKKFIKVDGRYFMDLYIPGWKSIAYKNFIEGEINRILPVNTQTNRFSNIFIAITKKCHLLCDHCFEWEALNGIESLSLSDLKIIVSKFQEKGTALIQFTGGEPMLRVEDMIDILKTAKKNTDFWVLTSGYNFTYDNAQKLKNAGLTGVVISLDHFDPEIHNIFRGNINSFRWVEEAVENSIKSKLVTALCICVSNSFISESNLFKYIELAKKMGVSFVQILEPKAVGHYLNKDVELTVDKIKLLEDFYLKLNFDKKYLEYPIISYHGYYQRRIGCFASANRNVYIDTDGDIHACPFCRTKMGSVLTGDIDKSINELQNNGCHSFKTVNF
ncbi:MAG: radical SAM protein [Bacteroidales bacterium]